MKMLLRKTEKEALRTRVCGKTGREEVMWIQWTRTRAQPIKQTEDRVWLGSSETNFQRDILQGVSFKTRPIKTPGASLNGPFCLTLLQAPGAPDSCWGPPRAPSLQVGCLVAGPAPLPFWLPLGSSSRRSEFISIQSTQLSVANQSCKLISTTQME